MLCRGLRTVKRSADRPAVFVHRRYRDLGLRRRIARSRNCRADWASSNRQGLFGWAIHLLAFVLVGGMAVGDADGKVPAGKLPPPATASDLQLEKAARDYRIQTYETFHKDRAEYDRRQAEAASVQKAWTDAGENDEEQPKLIDWLESGDRSLADRLDRRIAARAEIHRRVAKERAAEKNWSKRPAPRRSATPRRR